MKTGTKKTAGLLPRQMELRLTALAMAVFMLFSGNKVYAEQSVAAPTYSLESNEIAEYYGYGYYYGNQTITLETATEGAEIYYVLQWQFLPYNRGSDFRYYDYDYGHSDIIKYTSPITLREPEDTSGYYWYFVQAYAVKNGVESEYSSLKYYIKNKEQEKYEIVAPTFSLKENKIYYGGQKLVLETETEDAEIYYKIDLTWVNSDDEEKTVYEAEDYIKYTKPISLSAPKSARGYYDYFIEAYTIRDGIELYNSVDYSIANKKAKPKKPKAIIDCRGDVCGVTGGTVDVGIATNVTDRDGNIIKNAKLTYSSSNKKVATVTKSGIVKCKKTGITTITIKTPGTKEHKAAKKKVKVGVISKKRLGKYVGERETVKLWCNGLGEVACDMGNDHDGFVLTPKSKNVYNIFYIVNIKWVNNETVVLTYDSQEYGRLTKIK